MQSRAPLRKHRAVLGAVGIGLLVALAVWAGLAWPNAPWAAAAVAGLAATALVLAIREMAKTGHALLRSSLDHATNRLVGLSAERKMDEAASKLSAQIHDVRAKQSRHEYAQEMLLKRIEAVSTRTRAAAEFNTALLSSDRGERRGVLARVLMVTTNGAGLGHLTRCLALAHALPDEVVVDIVTMSTAAPLVTDERVAVHYHPSKDVLGLSQSEWDARFGQYLVRMLRASGSDVVLFDGTFIYRPVHEITRRLMIPLVWVCRGCWRDGRTTEQTLAPAEFVDGVLLPDDYGAPGDFPINGALLPVLQTPPLVGRRRGTALQRAAALAELGLDDDRHHVLIQLGAGNIDATTEKVRTAVQAVLALGERWVPVLLDSPIARTLAEASPNVVRIRRYPIAPLFAAFEFAITAAGYNAVQEAVVHQLPVLLVPNTETVTDDQVKRARGAAEQGLALCAETPDEIASGVIALVDAGVRREMSATQHARTGAEAGPATPAIHQWLVDLVEAQPGSLLS